MKAVGKNVGLVPSLKAHAVPFPEAYFVRKVSINSLAETKCLDNVSLQTQIT